MSFIKNLVQTIHSSPSLGKLIRRTPGKDREPASGEPSTRQVFTKIYDDGVWGKSADTAEKFYSGSGSHDDAIVETYVTAVRGFLSSLSAKPDVVDLGCGDFHIGSRVRPLCANYIACDIVEALIGFNKEKYRDLDVDFRVLDLTTDRLPRGDVVFVRQVLQHLSNDQIQRALPRISANFKYLVVTEHLPGTGEFVPNLDKKVGSGIRLAIDSGVDSGVVLTRPPFNLRPLEQTCLCEVEEYGGRIRTDLFRLA